MIVAIVIILVLGMLVVWQSFLNLALRKRLQAHERRDGRLWEARRRCAEWADVRLILDWVRGEEHVIAQYPTVDQLRKAIRLRRLPCRAA